MTGIKSNINEYNRFWTNNPLVQEISSFVDDSVPDSKEYLHILDERSKSFFEKFCEENKIEIIEYDPRHIEPTWGSYFLGVAPYSSIKQRKDIPDSWVYFTALDIKNKYKNIYCITDDKNLSQHLAEAGCYLCNDIRSFLSLIVTESTGTDNITKSKSDVSGKNQLTHALDMLASNERVLQTKILGYISWFDVIPKHMLIEYLGKEGFSPSSIENMAQRFSIAGFIQDTGNNYIVAAAHKEVFQIAKLEVQDDIIKLLGDNKNG